MQALSYRILLNKEPEGGYTVAIPSLPGCVTYGEGIEQAVLFRQRNGEGVTMASTNGIELSG